MKYTNVTKETKKISEPDKGIPLHLSPKKGTILKLGKKRTPRAVFLAHEKALTLHFFAPDQQYKNSKCAASKICDGS